MSPSVVKIALVILGLVLLVCLGGIIWLASANPQRSIPDVLVATPSAALAGILGILIPSRPAP
jgi:hypothetical protein